MVDFKSTTSAFLCAIVCHADIRSTAELAGTPCVPTTSANANGCFSAKLITHRLRHLAATFFLGSERQLEPITAEPGNNTGWVCLMLNQIPLWKTTHRASPDSGSLRATCSVSWKHPEKGCFFYGLVVWGTAGGGGTVENGVSNRGPPALPAYLLSAGFYL